ncbi:MAG: DUF853 family protein, partial [Proteobacteria bacterium]|nr:DUF853 family protein [Pseudomonadota bacterium]
DQKAVRAAAETFRPNPAFDTEDAIRDVGVGEALVSTLVNKGEPSMVQRVLIRPPSSQLGPISIAERDAIMAASPVAGIYDTTVDRKSAFEALAKRAKDAADAVAKSEEEAAEPDAPREFNTARRYSGNTVSKSNSTRANSSRRSDSASDAFMKSMARSVGTRAGSALVRGILGSLFKSR